jgi:hypothetical protein
MTRLRIALVLSAVMVVTELGSLDVRAEASLPAGNFPPNCGAGILTPVKSAGLIIAREEAECDAQGGPVPFFRLRVTLARRVRIGGVWRHVATAIGETPYVTSYYLVKVASPCRPGTYRTKGAVRYRFDTSDPWTIMIKEWGSPRDSFRRCPQDT